LSLSEEECALAGADFDVHRAGTSEKFDKVNFTVQILGLERYFRIIS